MRLIFIAMLAAMLAACAPDAKTQYHHQSAKYIYAKGHQYLKNADYADAVEAFEALNAQFPFGSYSKKANLALIYAYYKEDNPALALASAERFLKLYPNSQGAAYAYYMSGVIDFNNGRGLLQRYFPYDMSEHMPSNYDTAFKTFNIVLKEFPKSAYAKDARRRMIYLKNIMARYQLNVAKFYFKREAYPAAINRAKNIILHYPRTTSLLPAIRLTQRAYTELGLTKLAKDMQLLYQKNDFSQSERQAIKTREGD